MCIHVIVSSYTTLVGSHGSSTKKQNKEERKKKKEGYIKGIRKTDLKYTCTRLLCLLVMNRLKSNLIGLARAQVVPVAWQLLISVWDHPSVPDQ